MAETIRKWFCDRDAIRTKLPSSLVVLTASFLLALAAPPHVWAQDDSQQGGAQAREYLIPAQKLTCLVENQDKYIELPRAIILFTPALCPLVGNEEAAYLAQNSATDDETAVRLMMRKSDFSCLVTKIDDYLQDIGETEPGDDEIAFILDCP